MTDQDETVEVPVGQRADGSVPDTSEGAEQAPPEDGDTFPREYVERLRAEAAERRTEAREAREALEPLQRRLLAALVAGTGRLADPTDLAFDAELLDDDAALGAALDDLLAAKPHLASRRVSGDVGQGRAVGAGSGFSLAGALAERA
ncbi:hypothetical protein [Dermacoccus nishinomiyaensis]|uniref:hypothetical protein n=1 Tax=Dermacoccus nishinomiyaensis TaxID=1274 RepID=UPI00248F19CC|nr:hypothetical protein [Dermacoccus nishinomiyaensis]